MRPEQIRLPNGLTLIGKPTRRGCDGCWFHEVLGGCIGYLQHQPGCGELTRTDGLNIIWVQQDQKGTTP